MPEPLQHFEARCEHCEACQHLTATRRIVLAQSAPAGPGITQREADLWNVALRDNPCQHPLVHVAHNNHIVKARVVSQDPARGTVRVSTAEYGEIEVPQTKIKPWTPANCLEGIPYAHLEAALLTFPATWYHGILTAVIQAANAKNVFSPGGASRLVQRIEQTE